MTTDTLFEVNLQLSHQYKAYLEDVMKVLITMVVYHLIGNLIMNGQMMLPEMATFSILLVIAGLSIYHLIFKKIVKFQLEK